ncbi:MAG: hypothetical protein CVV05_01575 [Gammaproteobacteria bacterium HGW-Gammaproteobacteria-1]|jgi:hypothetical protein|nr:MAG: hypothetical protein CVV05_01575 [Gammaproteobacteria bacterium HGW-Gammaproteobacteria-1]
MATLHECLKELPSDMTLVNLVAARDRVRTAGEWLESVPDEDGYEVRRRMERKSVHTHDKHERVSIGWIGGRNLMNQV